MRLRSTAPLNSRLNWSRLLGDSDVSGGWPLGGEPQKYQKIRHARAERAAITAAMGVARSATLMRLPLGALLKEPASAFPLTEHHCDLGTDDRPGWVISSR